MSQDPVLCPPDDPDGTVLDSRQPGSIVVPGSQEFKFEKRLDFYLLQP